jgi:membrane protease YdiL (CAAX protease family)
MIWYKDGILKIDVKPKYVVYYTALLLISLYVFPKDLSLVFDVFTHAPLREEIIFRFFMIGIFYKYYKFEDENKSYFVRMLFASNIIFMILHSYNVGIFFTGLILSIIYIKGGLVSSMLAHTIYNLYLSNEYFYTKFLVFMPIVFSISDARTLYENMSEKKTKKS